MIYLLNTLDYHADVIDSVCYLAKIELLRTSLEDSIMRRLIRLFVFFSVIAPNQLLAAELAQLRTNELKMLSVCPSKPSLAVQGSAPVGVLVTELSNTNDLIVVERSHMPEYQFEICSSAIDPGTAVAAGNLIFATHLFSVTGDLGSNGGTFNIQGIRTDTGAVVYSESFNVTSQENFESSTDTAVAGMRAAVLENPVSCQDKYSFVVEETVQLECSGNTAPLSMNYGVSGELNLEYLVNDVTVESRGVVQNRSGKVRIKPSVVTTTLHNTIQRGGDCPQTYDTTRTIPISLKANERAATFKFFIPQDVRNEWKITPSLSASRPLLEGSAVLKNNSIASDCDSPPGSHTTETPYKHLELNTFVIAEQAFSPVCAEESQTELVFSRTPKFGVTPLPAPSLDCSVNRGSLTYHWERQF